MPKKLILFIVIILISGKQGFADEKKNVKSTLESVTVFFQGAELIHKAQTTLTKGDNEVWIEGLSPSIDRNSLKISTTNGVVVTSYEFAIDFLEDKKAPANEKRLKDSIDLCKKQLKDIEVKLKTNADLLGLLQANKSIAGTQNGLSVTELMKMMDYYQLKSNELQREKSALDEKDEKLDELLEKLESQLEEGQTKNTKTSGILKLKLTAPMAVNSTFDVSYYTTASGWSPYYDINVSNTDKPIKMQSKAKVKQTTGIDWKRVKLTLSTSAPSRGKVASLFSAWFLDFVQPVAIQSKLSGMVPGVAVQNSYSYMDMEAIEAPANIRVRGTSSLNDNNQPMYVVDGVPMSANEFKSISPDMIKDINVLKDASSTAIYGSRAANGVILVTTKSRMDDFVSRDENQLNMVYNIDLPYTIEGNGKEQSIDLQAFDVTADFKYYSTPKLDQETFLLAEIGDWQKLGLLSGKANITFDGTYVGESLIDVNSTHDKLTLTLGTDKRIAVKREKLQDFSSRKFLGNDVKQEFVYQITVKNNQNQPVKLVLKDQYPLTSQKDIEVEQLKETTVPTLKNEDVGVLVWEFELKAGETKVFKNAYSVKYPKNKQINL